MIAYAAATDVAQSFVGKINTVILFPLITLMMVIALIIFLWGGFEYVRGANEPTAREKGKKHLIWGVIGLLVMLSAFSILTIAANTFGIKVENNTAPASGLNSGATDLGATRPQPRPTPTPLPTTPTSGQPAGSLQYMADELVNNGVSRGLAEAIASALLLTSGNESSVRTTLDTYVSNSQISVTTRDRVLQQFGY